MTLESRIELIADKVRSWLESLDSSLQEAAEKTVKEDYFNQSDVIYAIQCLRQSVTLDKLKKWAQKGKVKDHGKNPQKVLCLHAGNLPLVGFQDALAALISGHHYFGKISRKDPYLLPDFLSRFEDTPLYAKMQWNTTLNHFQDLNADAVTFSGSESSIPSVMQAIKEHNIAKANARYLIRKAHFSIAYFDAFNDVNSKNLVNAILRYDGKGCRSVAIVVSPVTLAQIRCSFTDYFEAFWMHHPTYRKPTPKITYRSAYDKAVGKTHMLLEHLIIEEADDPKLDEDHIIYWVEGDVQKMIELANKYGDQVQNVYVPSMSIPVEGYEDRKAPLSEAQCPPIDWKPDGMDILGWLDELGE